MKPGIYKGMPEKDYFAIEALSNSGMSKLAKAPAAFKYFRDHPEADDTPSKIFGRLFHIFILEESRFNSEFAIGPDVNKNTKDWKEFVRASSGKKIISNSELTEVSNMKTALKENQEAWKILQLVEDFEMVMVWEDPNTGVLCKAKLDGLCPTIGVIPDLKTTKDASRNEFSKSLFNYGYFRQAAFSMMGANILGYKITDFVDICIESSAPYLNAVYKIRKDAVQIGMDQIKYFIKLYKKCLDSGEWPGYSNDLDEGISLPDWVLKTSSNNVVESEIEF